MGPGSVVLPPLTIQASLLWQRRASSCPEAGLVDDIGCSSLAFVIAPPSTATFSLAGPAAAKGGEG